MSGVPWWGYVLILAGSAGLALALTPVARTVAIRFGVLDHPKDYKQQTEPVPYLGGAAIVVAFAGVVLAAALLRPPVSGLGELVGIMGLAVGLSLVGLVDDIQGLGPWTRLGLQTAAAVGIIGLGVQVEMFDVAWLNIVFTLFWIVGVTNAFNLLDNMDGLSSGVTAVAAGWFLIIAAVNGQFLVASLSAALAGCALGFLWHNFHPARIYMGDAGSLFFGFLLAVLGIKLRFAGPNEVTFFVPILVVGVAIFDTVLVTVTRLLHRRKVLSGGRDHVSHRLVFVGIPVPAAVALMYAAAFASGWLALVMSRIDRLTGFLLMCFVVAVVGFTGTLLGRLPVYETSGRRRVMLREVTDHDEPAPTSLEKKISG